MEKQNIMEISNFKITDGEKCFIDVTNTDKIQFDCKFRQELWVTIENIEDDTRFYFDVSCYNYVRNIFNKKLVQKYYINDEEYLTLYKNKVIKIANLFQDNFRIFMIRNMELKLEPK